MGKQTFIEINGKKYDAVTGRLLDNATPDASAAAPSTVQPARNVGVVDGFSKRSRPAKSRKPAKHASKTPQKSKTLMRQAVNKPNQPTTTKEKPNVQGPRFKPPAGRVARAQETRRSPHVNRFSQDGNSGIVKREANLSVQPQPQHNSITHTPQRQHNRQQPENQDTTQNPQPEETHTNAAHKLIEAAFSRSDSHEQAPTNHKKKRFHHKVSKKFGISSKTLSTSSAILAGVLLVGFFAIQNIPNLSMRVAATRAGFSAEMPDYAPAGFGFRGPINYRTGQVRVTFESNSDDRTYEVVQTNSNWNSDALLANYVEAENKQYQTYIDRGRTLFIYDGSNATWVNNGIWYQIEGDSDLTTDQLIRIASSI